MKSKFLSKFLTLIVTLFLAGSMAVAQTGTAKAKSRASNKSDGSQMSSSSADKSSMSRMSAKPGSQIDLNSASRDELKAQPGVGDATAEKIIAGRPYANKRQLVSKMVVSEKFYSKISNQIIAKQDSAAGSRSKPGSDMASSSSTSASTDQTSGSSKGKKKKKIQ